MKRKLKALTCSFAISIALLSVTVLVTGCDEGNNPSNPTTCPSGFSRLGSSNSDADCLRMCSNATSPGRVAIWNRLSNGTCCCTR